ncbi:hypothetical protein D3C76_1715800 [compost metagenome]
MSFRYCSEAMGYAHENIEYPLAVQADPAISRQTKSAHPNKSAFAAINRNTLHAALDPSGWICNR